MKWPVIAAVLIAAVLLVGAIALATARSGTWAPVGRVSVPAPIDQVEIVVRESAPPQVSVKITAGLPSGCAQRESHAVSRNGDTFTVTVLNSMPRGDQACTTIYGSYSLSVDLFGELWRDVTYTVQVNDTVRTFRL